MGRKVHPIGFRLGIIRDWDARWYAEGRQYRELLQEDLAIRGYIRREIGQAGITRVEIERFPNQLTVIVHTARPGIVIGRRGASVNVLRQGLEELTGKRVRIDVQEVAKPELEAPLVAESVVMQLERRVSSRRAMRQAIERARRSGAQGVRIECAGRLAGAEMARRENMSEGKVPRQTLRADIDFARYEASTPYGRIGVKVWIYKGEILPGGIREEERGGFATL